MQSTYSPPNPPKSRTHPKQPVEEFAEDSHTLYDVRLLEREVHDLRDPKLGRIVERLKTSQACLLRGEPVPREALRELVIFVFQYSAPAAESGTMEVFTRG